MYLVKKKLKLYSTSTWSTFLGNYLHFYLSTATSSTGPYTITAYGLTNFVK